MKFKIYSTIIALAIIMPSTYVVLAENADIKSYELRIQKNEDEKIKALKSTSEYSQSDFKVWDGDILKLTDGNKTTHALSYKSHTEDSFNVGSYLWNYRTAGTSSNESYLYIIKYVEQNGKLVIESASVTNISGGFEGSLKTEINIAMTKGQDYLYFTFGVSKNYYDYVEDIVFDSSVDVKRKNVFSDWGSHFGRKEISKAMNNGWVVETNKFRPNEPITRAEFIKIVNKYSGFTAKATVENFTDVDPKEWWYNEVLIGLKNGYISSSNTKFRPKEPITREEVANIITTITKTKDKNLDKIERYSDRHLISKSALSSVEGAIEKGFMGVNSTVFNPKKNITRGEAIVTLSRASSFN